ncbi:hypothetical protein [Spongiivirga citrea]|uniref:Uncharacterized protein n=1 Tax=Spongiivirga citrea TaxID=1481457 RepID=A0A6M0CMJ6_9FLAO|nr:hypothetical protein [Spongiivirga citrea]NER17234.1 hypothetical protein [Spongiivirga citrea]
MKAVTVKQLKDELKHLSQTELIALCLRLSKFKKENKELLTYLLFEASNEEGYIETIKNEIDEQFDEINTSSYFYIKKSARKILRNVKKYIRYSLNKETEVALLLYYCQKLGELNPSIKRNTTLMNLYNRQLALAKKRILLLHEDLQYDFNMMITDLE